MRRCTTIFIFLWINIATIFANVNFDTIRGSELLLGAGANSAGKSGAGIAQISSIEALYWNPAGLAGVKKIVGSTTGTVLSGWNDYSLLIPGEAITILPNSLTLAGGYFTRLQYSGEGLWQGFASHILDLSMLDVSANYQGIINSKTVDYRLALAWEIPHTSFRFGSSLCYLH